VLVLCYEQNIAAQCFLHIKERESNSLALFEELVYMKSKSLLSNFEDL